MIVECSYCLSQVGYAKELKSGLPLVLAVFVVPAALSDVCKSMAVINLSDSPVSESFTVL